MRWSWNHATDEVWRQLDPELWELTHNPWVVLQTVSRERMEPCPPIPLSAKASTISCEGAEARQTPAWFHKAHPNRG